jgi:hypothetical protein
VFRGERPFEDLKAFTDCRARMIRPEARKALALALKAAAPAGGSAVSAAAAMPVAAVSVSAVPPGTGAASAQATKPHKKRAKATRKPPAESKTTPSS